MDRSELYDKMAQRKSKPKDFEPYAGDNGRVNKALALYRTGKLKTNPAGLHMDVGGAIGDLGYALRQEKLFAKTLVIDISAKNLEAARKKGNWVCQADIDRHGFNLDDPQLLVDHDFSSSGLLENGNEQFDAISALDFIEHIIDPTRFAAECFWALKPGGEVFINTPNIRFWKHIHQLWFGGSFPHTSGDTDVFHGGHLAFFTAQDLKQIFGSVGFKNFEVFKDDEGFDTPPQLYTDPFKPKTQAEYVNLAIEFGCPNLLFKAVKP